MPLLRSFHGWAINAIVYPRCVLKWRVTAPPERENPWDLAESGVSVFGAQGRNRTADTGIFNPLLYQLSYLGNGAQLNGFSAAVSTPAKKFFLFFNALRSPRGFRRTAVPQFQAWRSSSRSSTGRLRPSSAERRANSSRAISAQACCADTGLRD